MLGWRYWIATPRNMPTESRIISRLKKLARVDDRVLVGIGDDAAVIKGSGGAGGKDLLVCCDLMVEGIHFRAEWAPPRLLGRKALAVNLSDIAAMGGVAKFALVSIALPHKFSSVFIDEIFQGLFDLADASGVSIVGGDTSSSPDSLFIDVGVIGDCESGRAVTRRGAKVGDTIYVSGSLGASALGLSLLEEGFRLEDDANFQEALLKHLAPEPRLDLGRAIGEAGLATAMIDISDGLSTDLWHLLDESNCGALIHAGAIPIAECVRRASPRARLADPLQLALNSGEEYELLFTVPPQFQQRMVELSSKGGVDITAVGEIVAGRRLRLERNGVLEPVESAGYEHRF
jgi:thiamine-monophosphate kinase